MLNRAISLKQGDAGGKLSEQKNVTFFSGALFSSYSGLERDQQKQLGQ